MGGTKLFKAVYGGVSRTTWSKWKATGKIPPPDKQIGALSFWREQTIWRTVTGETSSETGNIVAFRGGDVTVVFRAGAPELTETERTAIATATGQVRFFLCSWSDTPFPPDGHPLQNYPADSIAWAIDRSTLVEPRLLDCTPSRDAEELVAQLLATDADADDEDHRVSFTMMTLTPFDPRKLVAQRRERAPADMPE